MRALGALGVFFVAAVGASGDGPKQIASRRADDLAADYVYPGAVALGDTCGGGTTPVYLGTFVTPDGGEKVIDWYQAKIGKLARPRAQGIAWGGYEGHAILHDRVQPAAKGAVAEPRPVAVAVFTERRAGFTLTATVSRAAGEAHTHIVLILTQHPAR